MIGFWRRLRYAIDFWPIERPLRWIFNMPMRDKPTMIWARGNDRLWLEGNLPEHLRDALASGLNIETPNDDG
jgi:hypothetical protein